MPTFQKIVKRFPSALAVVLLGFSSAHPALGGPNDYTGTCSQLTSFVLNHGVVDDAFNEHPGFGGWTRPDFASKVIPILHLKHPPKPYMKDGLICTDSYYDINFTSVSQMRVITWHLDDKGCAPCSCQSQIDNWQTQVEKREEAHKIALAVLGSSVAPTVRKITQCFDKRPPAHPSGGKSATVFTEVNRVVQSELDKLYVAASALVANYGADPIPLPDCGACSACAAGQTPNGGKCGECQGGLFVEACSTICCAGVCCGLSPANQWKACSLVNRKYQCCPTSAPCESP